MATELNRKDIIDCLRNWRISYEVTGNAVVIDKSIQELVGEGRLSWFSYSASNDFENNDNCSQLNYDARSALIALWGIKNSLSIEHNEYWDAIRTRIFNGFTKVFLSELSAILAETDPSVKKTKLLPFILKCEQCFQRSQNNLFVNYAKEAKKADVEIDNWIQMKVHQEVGYTPHPDIDAISDNFLNLIADSKAIPAPHPGSYHIEQQDNSNMTGLKMWYSKYGWQTHLVAMLIIGGLFYVFFSDYESLWLIECLLAIALTNLLIWFYFKFFYREHTNNTNNLPPSV